MNNLTPDTLRIIRRAMLLGIVILGAVAFYVSATSPLHAANSDGALGYVAVFAVLSGAGVVMFVRRRIEGAGQPDRSKWILVAAAACEGAALISGVLLLLSGSFVPYLAALIIFGFSLVLLPVEQPR